MTALLILCLMSITACQAPRSVTEQPSEISTQQTLPPETNEAHMPTTLPSADMHLIVLQPSATASSKITVDLDGTQITQPLSGIAVRILFDTTSSENNPKLPTEPFTVPVALTQAGWTIAVNRLTSNHGSTAAELALITTSPQGLELGELTLLGTLKLPSADSAYQPTFDTSATQAITKSAQVVPLNLTEQYLTDE